LNCLHIGLISNALKWFVAGRSWRFDGIRCLGGVIQIFSVAARRRNRWRPRLSAGRWAAIVGRAQSLWRSLAEMPARLDLGLSLDETEASNAHTAMAAGRAYRNKAVEPSAFRIVSHERLGAMGISGLRQSGDTIDYSLLSPAAFADEFGALQRQAICRAQLNPSGPARILTADREDRVQRKTRRRSTSIPIAHQANGSTAGAERAPKHWYSARIVQEPPEQLERVSNAAQPHHGTSPDFSTGEQFSTDLGVDTTADRNSKRKTHECRWKPGNLVQNGPDSSIAGRPRTHFH